jgi:hypothetical protein
MAMVIETVADVGVADACEQGEHGLLAQAGAGQPERIQASPPTVGTSSPGRSTEISSIAGPAFRHSIRRHGHGRGPRLWNAYRMECYFMAVALTAAPVPPPRSVPRAQA